MRLKKLEASEMVDVIHAIYEDDNTVMSEVEYRVQHAVRGNIYRMAYEREYRYSPADEAGANGWSDDADSAPSAVTKPYMPPTPVNADSARPYGAALDSPVG